MFTPVHQNFKKDRKKDMKPRDIIENSKIFAQIFFSAIWQVFDLIALDIRIAKIFHTFKSWPDKNGEYVS